LTGEFQVINTTHTKPAKHFAISSLASAIVLALSSAPTLAQEADESAQVELIRVTGSRIVRRDESAPSPIVTVNENFIEDTGEINIEATLNEMPQFTRDSSGGQGEGGRALLDLRGLGSTRNLVLLDGKRLPISSSSGVVDTNILNTAIIKDIEVITGGASAVYGSDAVSGVVNFITVNDY
jgi:outer membrane cobalamin receptor